jgi:hypothetical protein
LVTGVSVLGLTVDLVKYKPTYKKDDVYRAFLESMKLTVKQGSLLKFDNIICEGESFSQLVHYPGSEGLTGLQFGDSGLDLGPGESIDFKYTLLMDEASGNETENLTASVDFVIDVADDPEGKI